MKTATGLTCRFRAKLQISGLVIHPQARTFPGIPTFPDAGARTKARRGMSGNTGMFLPAPRNKTAKLLGAVPRKCPGAYGYERNCGP